MRIWMLSYYYWPTPAGGAESQCRKLAAALAARGHDCTVLTSRQQIADVPKQTEASGVRIIRVPILDTLIIRRKAQLAHLNTPQKSRVEEKKRSVILRISEKIASIASFGVRYSNSAIFLVGVLFCIYNNHKKIDILHVHSAEWTAGLAALIGNFLRIPVLCKGTNIPVFPKQQAVPLGSLFDIWRRRPYFIALTAAMQDDFLRNGVPSNKIKIIPNGVTLPHTTAPVASNTQFLYIGNFSQSASHKAFDVLIAAWAAFNRLRPAARLIMLGRGDSRAWQTLANNLGCADSIEFAGYHSNLSQYFEQACCILLPSRREGISNALLEAQSWGIPAIVSDIPGNIEVVEHQKNGLIIPVNNIEALKNACLLLFDNPLLRIAYGEASRRRINFFSMDRITDMIIDFYKILLQESIS